MRFIGSEHYPDLIEEIASHFKSAGSGAPRWKLIGLLFARKGDAITDKKLIPHFGYLDVRSGSNVDIYWVGWGTRFDDTPGSPTCGSTTMIFDAERFESIRRTIEENIGWQYGGGAELLLFAALWDQSAQRVTLELGYTMSIDLRAVEKDGVDPDVLMQEVFRFADTYDGEEQPMIALLFDKTRKSMSGVIWSIVHHLLPKKTAEEIEKFSRFALKDLSVSGTRPINRLGPPTKTVTHEFQGSRVHSGNQL